MLASITHCTLLKQVQKWQLLILSLVQSVLHVSWHLSMPTPPNMALFRLEAAQLTTGGILCLMCWSRLLPKRRAAICLLILHVPSVYIELIANLQVLWVLYLANCRAVWRDAAQLRVTVNVFSVISGESAIHNKSHTDWVSLHANSFANEAFFLLLFLSLLSDDPTWMSSHAGKTMKSHVW